MISLGNVRNMGWMLGWLRENLRFHEIQRQSCYKILIVELTCDARTVMNAMFRNTIRFMMPTLAGQGWEERGEIGSTLQIYIF